MRLAFEEFNLVKVMDTKRQELVCGLRRRRVSGAIRVIAKRAPPRQRLF